MLFHWINRYIRFLHYFRVPFKWFWQGYGFRINSVLITTVISNLSFLLFLFWLLLDRNLGFWGLLKCWFLSIKFWRLIFIWRISQFWFLLLGLWRLNLWWRRLNLSWRIRFYFRGFTINFHLSWFNFDFLLLRFDFFFWNYWFGINFLNRRFNFNFCGILIWFLSSCFDFFIYSRCLTLYNR